jgi:hypothetical protein
MARSGHPAIRAGTASMMAVEGSGAEPAGTYRPTRLIGRVMRSQRTPGMVSTDSGCGSCASWKRVTLVTARSSAAISRAPNAARAAANSAALTRSCSSEGPPNFCV